MYIENITVHTRTREMDGIGFNKIPGCKFEKSCFSECWSNPQYNQKDNHQQPQTGGYSVSSAICPQNRLSMNDPFHRVAAILFFSVTLFFSDNTALSATEENSAYSLLVLKRVRLEKAM